MKHSEVFYFSHLTPFTPVLPYDVMSDDKPIEANLDAAEQLMLTYNNQINEQLAKVIETIGNYEKGLEKAKNVQARLEGQRDLVNAFSAQYKKV